MPASTLPRRAARRAAAWAGLAAGPLLTGSLFTGCCVLQMPDDRPHVPSAGTPCVAAACGGRCDLHLGGPYPAERGGAIYEYEMAPAYTPPGPAPHVPPVPAPYSPPPPDPTFAPLPAPAPVEPRGRGTLPAPAPFVAPAGFSRIAAPAGR